MPAETVPSETPATCAPEPRLGSICPRCGEGRLDYNGLLELECPQCGFILPSGGGCT